jgi:uncharacterized membrane protein YeaQ/YmgE (transglycosylase-associated protein family)
VSWLGFVVLLLVSGLIVGALGRLIIPGPDPMGIAMTILIGLGGSFLAGVVTWLIFGRDAAPGLILSVLGAGFLVWLMRRARRA